MIKSLFWIVLLVCSIADAQIHIKIRNNNGKLVKCDKVTFVNAEGKEGPNILCLEHEVGCCILSGACGGIAKLIIEPADQHNYSKKITRRCDVTECIISPKFITSNFEKAASKHLKNNKKAQVLLYNKSLVFEFANNEQKAKALEYEKQSYLILGELLLNDNSSTLVKIENNDIFVDERLRQAIKDYQVTKNLPTQNGEFTQEVAKSFPGNKNLFLKDKVFTHNDTSKGDF